MCFWIVFFKSKENYLTNQKHIRIIVQYENLGDRMKIQLSKIISVPKYEETVEAPFSYPHYSKLQENVKENHTLAP